MRRLLKILGITIVSLIVLVIVAVVALTQLINPNDYKPQIEQMAMQKANLNVNIEGDLGWTFWPSLGVSIGKTEVRIADKEQLFAGIQQVNASVAVWPLLFGNVQVDGLSIDGLKVHLIKTKEGGNWTLIGSTTDTSKAATTPTKKPTTQSAPVQQPAGNSQSTLHIPVVIPEVTINNAEFTYDDNTSGTHLSVSQVNLHATDVNLADSTPFPLSLSLRYQDNTYRVDASLDANISLDLAGQHYRLAPMTLDATVKGATPKPVDIHLTQTLDANLSTGIVSLKDLILKAAGVTLNANVQIKGINDGKMQFGGQLKVAPFDANRLLAKLGMSTIKTANPKALSHIAVTAALKGPANSLMVNPLVVTLDSSTLKGTAGLANFNTGKILFDLALDKIALADYLPPKSTAQASAKTASSKTKSSSTKSHTGAATGGNAKVTKKANQPLSKAPLLPLDTLRGLRIDGRFQLGQFSLDTIKGSDIVVKVDAENGNIQLSKAKGKLLGGSFNLTAGLNASGKTPHLSANGSVSGLHLQPAAIYALNKDFIKGKLTTDFQFNADGNSQASLMQSATGKLGIEVKDIIIRGGNLQAALSAGIQQMLENKPALSQLLTNYQTNHQRLEDTKIADLTADGTLANQIITIKHIQAALRKGNINGDGWLNINNQDFDFQIGLQSDEISDSPYLQDVNWPIRCAGNLSGEPASWCGPDRDALGDIAEQALAKAAKHKVAEKLKEKLGIDAKGDTAKEMVENATKKKADEAKQKAKEKVKNKLQDKLNDLFH